MTLFRVSLVLFALILALGLGLPDQRGLVWLAAPGFLVSLAFLALWPRRPPTGKGNADRPWVLVDGSNVMYWRDGKPDLATLRSVIGRLVDSGLCPGVVFDANAGYKTDGVFLSDKDLAARLGLPRENVFVVPRGEQADHYLLETARNMQAPIVTNDRYRDWHEQFPEARRHGALIRGGFRDNTLWLDPEPGGTADPATTG